MFVDTMTADPEVDLSATNDNWRCSQSRMHLMIKQVFFRNNSILLSFLSDVWFLL